VAKQTIEEEEEEITSLHCPALPCPALPCTACPALTCPALACHNRQNLPLLLIPEAPIT